MTFKQIVKSILPPFVLSVWHSVRRTFDGSVRLTYAPQGWETKLPGDPNSEQNFAKYMAHERFVCEHAMRKLDDVEPLLVEEDGSAEAALCIANMTYAYVLALAAHHKSKLRILDYGGNLADYYWFGKAMLPHVDLKYHCKELAAVADEGRKVSPAVIWHTDDTCFDQGYDVVMFSNSLQYNQNWNDLLRRAVAAVEKYFFLWQVPTVEHVPSYVALQQVRGMTMLWQALNRSDVLTTVESTGLRLVREFLTAERLSICNAPEQPSVRGWLFQRDGDQA